MRYFANKESTANNSITASYKMDSSFHVVALQITNKIA